jgi:hypothetical protein
MRPFQLIKNGSIERLSTWFLADPFVHLITVSFMDVEVV